MVAARLFALDKSNSEVAEACGVSLSSVKLWKRAWKREGTTGLSAKPHLGPEPLLSDDDLVRLEKLLLGGAHKAGFASDLWTCPPGWPN
jgi:transposase